MFPILSSVAPHAECGGRIRLVSGSVPIAGAEARGSHKGGEAGTEPTSPRRVDLSAGR